MFPPCVLLDLALHRSKTTWTWKWKSTSATACPWAARTPQRATTTLATTTRQCRSAGWAGATAAAETNASRSANSIVAVLAGLAKGKRTRVFASERNFGVAQAEAFLLRTAEVLNTTWYKLAMLTRVPRRFF